MSARILMDCGVFTLKWKLYLQIPKFYRERLQFRGSQFINFTGLLAGIEVLNQWLKDASELLCPPCYGLMRYGGAV